MFSLPVATLRFHFHFMIQVLVQSGGDVNERLGTKLVAPIHLAAEQGKLEVCRYLLEHGARASVADANGWTPLHFCARGSSSQHAAIVTLLMDAEADVVVDARTSSLLTPLHIAVQHGEGAALAQLLVRHGANVDARDPGLVHPPRNF